MLIVVDEGIIDQHLCPIKIKVECHFLQTLVIERLAHIWLPGGFAEQQQEPATARPRDFATQRAISESEIV